MKTLMIAIFLLIFFILSIPLFLIEILIGKFNPRFQAKSSQIIVVAAFNMILSMCGIKRTIIGQENVPKDEAVLYVGNHRSFFDILIGYTSVPTLTAFVAKKEMKKVPFIRIWMGFLNCLFLDRSNIKEGVKIILEGINLIKKGYSIFISPEGTRNKGEELLPFKEGSFKIAEKSGCAIIPVSMNNTDAIFERHLPWVKKAHVIIEFGKPIYTKDLSVETQRHLGTYLRSTIQETLTKNKHLITS